MKKELQQEEKISMDTSDIDSSFSPEEDSYFALLMQKLDLTASLIKTEQKSIDLALSEAQSILLKNPLHSITTGIFKENREAIEKFIALEPRPEDWNIECEDKESNFYGASVAWMAAYFAIFKRDFSLLRKWKRGNNIFEKTNLNAAVKHNYHENITLMWLLLRKLESIEKEFDLPMNQITPEIWKKINVNAAPVHERHPERGLSVGCTVVMLALSEKCRFLLSQLVEAVEILRRLDWNAGFMNQIDKFSRYYGFTFAYWFASIPHDPKEPLNPFAVFMTLPDDILVKINLNAMPNSSSDPSYNDTLANLIVDDTLQGKMELIPLLPRILRLEHRFKINLEIKNRKGCSFITNLEKLYTESGAQYIPLSELSQSTLLRLKEALQKVKPDCQLLTDIKRLLAFEPISLSVDQKEDKINKINWEEINIPPDRITFSESDKIGRGFCGVVFKGLYNRKMVAIKQIADPMLFNHEAKMIVLANEASDRVVKLEKICAQKHLLIMEFLPHDTLYKLLTASDIDSLPWINRVQIALDIAYALRDLHKLEILHGDLLVGNIMCDKLHGRLFDFSSSRLKYLKSTERQHGTLLDTPEARTGIPLGLTAEIYNFGSVLLQLSIPKESVQVTGGDPNQALIGGCPDALKHMIHACYQKEPAQRPTADQLVSMLQCLHAALQSAIPAQSSSSSSSSGSKESTSLFSTFVPPDFSQPPYSSRRKSDIRQKRSGKMKISDNKLSLTSSTTSRRQLDPATQSYGFSKGGSS